MNTNQCYVELTPISDILQTSIFDSIAHYVPI